MNVGIPAEILSLIAADSIPAFGLDDSWNGSRWFGGWGVRHGVVRSVQLGHGDIGNKLEPMVRVQTNFLSVGATHPELNDAAADAIRRPLARELHRYLLHEFGADGNDHSDVEDGSRPWDIRPDWAPVNIMVRGCTEEFRYMQRGVWWVAISRFGVPVVALRAREIQFASVTLEVVEDLDKYLSPRSGPAS
jgi:hypothetical protein